MPSESFDAFYSDPNIKTIVFDSFWRRELNNNQTDYQTATKLILNKGELRKSRDHELGRRLLFIGTRIGTFVLFDSWNDNANDERAINWPHNQEAHNLIVSLENPKIQKCFRKRGDLFEVANVVIEQIIGIPGRDFNISTFIETLHLMNIENKH